MPKFNIYKIDYWEALYKDGKLVAEGHHITPEDVMKAINAPFKSQFIDEFDEDEDEFPQDENELVTKFNLT